MRATPDADVAGITDTAKPLPSILSESDRDEYESELRRVLINQAARERAKHVDRQVIPPGCLSFNSATGGPRV